ncbi:MAG: SDR family NAD(P)-dependent oxidoreductase [Bacteroidales bacterium]|nr:SDR family NAD(P)-dependent oxidoreductase [Bacteroidales bacterium]
MEQKIAIITGADGGMGTAITKTVVGAGFHAVMASCRMERAAKVKEKLEKETGATIELLEMDLASVASVLQFAEQVKQRYDHIDLLLNNAGTLCHFPKETADHLEYTVGVNYFGHYVLSHALLPLMGEGTRVVNMVSLTYRYGVIRDTLFTPRTKANFNRFSTYSDSKLALLYFTLDAAEEWKEKGIRVNCADPGIVDTEIITMGNKVIDTLCDIFFRPIIRTPLKGAASLLRLALSEDTKDLTGQCFASEKPVAISPKVLNNPRRQWLHQQTEKVLADIRKAL